MVDEPLHPKTVVELGLSQVEKPETPFLSTDRVRANLPAIPDHIPAANRLIADLVDLAALLDRNPDREVARDRMRRRLVRNEGQRIVHFATIEFEPEIQKNGDVYAVAWYSAIPGERKSKKVVPLVYVGPEFLKRTSEGAYISGGSFQCILFKPETPRGFYKALPLGLADAKTIQTWNDAAKRRNQTERDPWPHIEPIQHDLRRPSTRRVWFIPHIGVNQQLRSEHSSRQFLGNHFGQKVFLAAKSKAPVPDSVVNDIQTFEKKHLFRIKRLEEKWIEVTWLGSSEIFEKEDRMSLADVRHEMDPFQVLSTTRLYVDWKTVDQSTRKWLNRAYSDKNPLYTSALQLGLVKESDDVLTKRIELEALWKEAVKLVRLEMIQAARVAHAQIRQAPAVPHVDEVFTGEANIETLIAFLNEPDDVIANWIGWVFNRPFDANSPFLMHVRAWFINTYIKPQMPARASTTFVLPDEDALLDVSEFLEELQLVDDVPEIILAEQANEPVLQTVLDPVRRLDFLATQNSTNLPHDERLDRDGLFRDDPVLPRRSIAMSEWFAPRGSGWDMIYTPEGVRSREEMIRILQNRRNKKP